MEELELMFVQRDVLHIGDGNHSLPHGAAYNSRDIA